MNLHDNILIFYFVKKVKFNNKFNFYFKIFE